MKEHRNAPLPVSQGLGQPCLSQPKPGEGAEPRVGGEGLRAVLREGGPWAPRRQTRFKSCTTERVLQAWELPTVFLREGLLFTACETGANNPREPSQVKAPSMCLGAHKYPGWCGPGGECGGSLVTSWPSSQPRKDLATWQ